jgi:biotin carboxyl carrier protein
MNIKKLQSVTGTLASAGDPVLSRLFLKVNNLATANSQSLTLLNELLPVLCDASGASIGALWLGQRDGAFRCVRAVGLDSTSIPNGEGWAKVVQNVDATFHIGDVDILTPTEDDGFRSDEPTEELVATHRQLLLPISYQRRVVAVFCIFQPLEVASDTKWQITDLAAIQQNIEPAVARLERSSPPSAPHDTQAIVLQQIARQEQISQMAGIVGRRLDEKDVAFDVVNELHRFFGEGRISLTGCQRNDCQIRAISNQPVFDKRSAEVIAIQHLAQHVAKTRQPIWHPEDGRPVPARLEQLLTRYYEAADARSIALLPLLSAHETSADPDDLAAVVRDRDARNGDLVGVLVVEGIDQSLLQNELLPEWNRVETIVVNAVANSRRHNGVFLMPVWRRLGQLSALFRGHHRHKAKAAVLLALAAVIALAVIPGSFKLRCNGAIQPAHRSQVYAEADGVVSQLLVKDGDWVTAGQVLMQLEDPLLDAEAAKAEGQLREAESRLRTCKLQRILGDFASEEEKQESVRQTAALIASVEMIQEQHALLKAKQEQLKITSPIDGQVVTWDLPRRLQGRPVKAGQQLLTVADAKGPWELELRMPDKRSGYMREAWSNVGQTESLAASYVLASHPTNIHHGRVREVSRSADIHEKDGNIVRVYVELDHHPGKNEVRTRPGTDVVAHIHVGRASVGYCKFYELCDWVNRQYFKYV